MDAPQRRRRPRALVVGAAVAVVGLAAAVLVAATAFPAAGTAAGTAAGGPDPVIAAAGDVACDPTSRSFRDGEGSSGSCRQQAVSDLLVDSGLTAVLALGDLQYYCGSEAAFRASYDRSWGRVKDITRPVPGNHEYIAKPKDGSSESTGCDAGNRAASGYYSYFGEAAHAATRGHYSFDLGTWHLVALNSNCTPAGGCQATSEQVTWLRDDLGAHPQACTLAFWHHPRFSSGEHGSDADYGPLWEVLHSAGVDVVLNAHEHIYERFAPQTPAGTPDEAHGIRQFTVGTGGANRS
jgi:acid phosphatase type 7